MRRTDAGRPGGVGSRLGSAVLVLGQLVGARETRRAGADDAHVRLLRSARMGLRGTATLEEASGMAESNQASSLPPLLDALV